MEIQQLQPLLGRGVSRLEASSKDYQSEDRGRLANLEVLPKRLLGWMLPVPLLTRLVVVVVGAGRPLVQRQPQFVQPKRRLQPQD